jgi:hypothetical protein
LMVVDGENPDRRTADAHDASPSRFPGVSDLDTRDHQERLRDVV